MLQNSALDIAIGLTLMYLMLSLACTVLNEFIATQLDLRSATLESGLRQILDDPEVQQGFYENGLISSVCNAVATGHKSLWSSMHNLGRTTVKADPDQITGDHPSYVSAETFTLALVGSLVPGSPTPGLADVQSAVAKLPESRIKDVLAAHLTAAQGSFDNFRQSLGTWFDDSMERLGGTYKRHLKMISIVVGCLIAVIVNADSFAVGYALWSDSDLRAKMVEVAKNVSAQGLPTPGAATTPSAVLAAFKDDEARLRPLPIGWHFDSTAPASSAPKTAWARIWGGLTTVAGWLLTGLALSLGAPFWFDLLSKFINIRGAGEKPARADSK